MTLIPKDGQIQYIDFKPSAEDSEAARKASEKFWTWVQAERAVEWPKIATPETALKGRERGELLSKLCKEYMETRK